MHAFVEIVAGRPKGRKYSSTAFKLVLHYTYTMSIPYPYPVSNSELLKVHNLESHFEGGFFKQTVALSSRSENGKRVQESSGSATDWLPNAPGRTSNPDQPMDATCIYYLITPEYPRGRMHMNNNAVR